MNTHISEALEMAGPKAKYDAEAKNILADKNILAWILKHCVAEFMHFSIGEIKKCMEGEPEIGSVPVNPGRVPEKITGMSTEDRVPNEGLVTYDIRFSAFVPGNEKKERIKLIINIEAQKKYHPGYDLVTRCIFYLARQLSAQLDTEFTADNYNDIKKVYSIWICMDAPEYAENTITRYSISQTPLIGDFKGTARYDLMTGIIICLGRKICKEKGSLLQLLGTLLTSDLSPEAKEGILKNEYGIEISVPMKEVLSNMCNLSDLIEERGIEKGIEKGRSEIIVNMYDKGMPLETIAEIAKMSHEDVKKLLDMAQNT